MENNNYLRYSYKFIFSDNSEKEFTIFLDKENLEIVRQANTPMPDWAEKNKFNCEYCPNRFTHCSIAINLNDIINFFSETPSYEKVKIYADINDRIYFKETSVQSGVGSIIGIIMVTSGCPAFNKLKPMVRFHLPFANIEETEFRVFSMYTLAQYLRMRNGKKPDWEMNELKNIYEDIGKINRLIAKKIADLERKDTSINAVVVLNNFADSVSFSLDDDDLSDIESLFKEWI